MTDHYETPHPDADACQHAGVGKACRPCREVLDNLHRINIYHVKKVRELRAEAWDRCSDDFFFLNGGKDPDFTAGYLKMRNPYRNTEGKTDD